MEVQDVCWLREAVANVSTCHVVLVGQRVDDVVGDTCQVKGCESHLVDLGCVGGPGRRALVGAGRDVVPCCPSSPLVLAVWLVFRWHAVLQF